MPAKTPEAIAAEEAELDRLALEVYDVERPGDDDREKLAQAVFRPVILGLEEGRVEMLDWVRGVGNFHAPPHRYTVLDEPWHEHKDTPNAGLLEGWCLMLGLDPDHLRAELLRLWDRCRAEERRAPGPKRVRRGRLREL